MRSLLHGLTALLAILVPPVLCSQNPSPTGARAATDLPPSLIKKITTGTAFSFVYDGKRSEDLLPRWKQSAWTESLRNGGSLRITSYRDPVTGIEVSREITQFPEVSAVECIIRIRNTGDRDSPAIEDILPLDLQVRAEGTGKIILHYARGSLATVEDYLPIDKEVLSGTELNLMHYVLHGSDQTDGQLPFFNLEWQGGGLIGAVGWSGQWAVKVNGENGRSARIRVGQQKTH